LVRLSDFDYDLPEELIAQTPLTDRAASRLLHLNPESGEVRHQMFRDVVDILQSGDVLVLNNTRVNAWRFRGKKLTGGEVEILCLNEVRAGVFESLIKPAKRLKPGATFELGLGVVGTILAGGEDPVRIVQLTCPDGNLNEKLCQIGEIPLPPYITEKLEDSERYQTVFSNSNGSAAAPTAGLHFTQDILDQLVAKGVKIVTVTLHVGIDTFRPIQVDDVTDHQMHGEVCEVSPEAADVINSTLAARSADIHSKSSQVSTNQCVGSQDTNSSTEGDSSSDSNTVERPNNVPTETTISLEQTDPGRVTYGSQVVGSSLSPSENEWETPGQIETTKSPRSLTRATQEGEPLRATSPQAPELQTPRIIAVGTTAVRTLETFANECGTITPGRQVSRIFITPGYQFQVVDGMFTNFHFPRTTMLLMISALSSREQILNAYQQAVKEKYRFLSFGDSMLLLKT
jgi:S-adenosylmethionine:tRNA ribosyltransferase-isomerase